MEPFAIAAIVAVLGLAIVDAQDDDDAAACVAVGQWLDPATGKTVNHSAAIARLAARDVVLLGESHTAVEHHRWQLHTIAALHGRRDDIVLGFESFPRSVQPALDAWVAGSLDEAAFLERTRWKDVWGVDAQFYLPLFHYARLHRIPMIALNVDRALVREVSKSGWAAVPDSDREGLDGPAAPDPEYKTWLRSIYDAHHDGGGASQDGDAAFERFVEAQTVWDHAMASAIADARKSEPRLVIGIAGRGHVVRGYGIPRQLRTLGVREVAVALPVETARDCPEPGADGRPAADLLFGVPEDPLEDAPSN